MDLDQRLDKLLCYLVDRADTVGGRVDYVVDPHVQTVIDAMDERHRRQLAEIRSLGT